MSAGDELPTDDDLGVADLHDAAAYDGDPYDRPSPLLDMSQVVLDPADAERLRARLDEATPRVFRSVIEQAQGRVIIGEIERDSPRVTDTEAGSA